MAGGKYGSTFIDRAFLEWLQPKLENQKLLPKDFRTGGHFVLTPMGRVLLRRFEPYKHAFSGTESADITLPRDTVVAAGQQGGIVNGVINLTE
jgi:hypothetical protein